MDEKLFFTRLSSERSCLLDSHKKSHCLLDSYMKGHWLLNSAVKSNCLLDCQVKGHCLVFSRPLGEILLFTRTSGEMSLVPSIRPPHKNVALSDIALLVGGKVRATSSSYKKSMNSWTF